MLRDLQCSDREKAIMLAVALMSVWNQRIGQRVRVIREGRDESLEKVSAEMGIKKATLSRLERGKMKWTAQYIEAASMALSLDPLELVFPGEHVAADEREAAILDAYRRVPEGKRRAAQTLLEALAGD